MTFISNDIVPVPLCMSCKFFNMNPTEEDYGLKCKAFPDGIPDAIINSRIIHTTAYPGDNGIVFEPVTIKKVVNVK
jgi:hypothetical protein